MPCSISSFLNSDEHLAAQTHPREVANHKAIFGLCVDPTSPHQLATYADVRDGQGRLDHWQFVNLVCEFSTGRICVCLGHETVCKACIPLGHYPLWPLASFPVSPLQKHTAGDVKTGAGRLGSRLLCRSGSRLQCMSVQCSHLVFVFENASLVHSPS